MLLYFQIITTYDIILKDYAVQMFLQSARRVQPGFNPSAHMAAVVRICQIVQGMPLALDLAAGWLTVLSPAEIADRLASGLDLLTSSRPDRPSRHREMRSVIDESWQMLSPAEQHLLMRLSFFHGGTTSSLRITHLFL
uniref:Uncharacterized protein n=1 Tax=Tolypothrix bouteillei VB521301 TaxID=1479485 RepID=A0A0C1QZB6_9CYAN